MSKKTVLAVIAVLFLAIIVLVLVLQRPSVEVTSPTLQNVKDHNNHIACEDALWLLDRFTVMIDEKLVQLEGFDTDGTELTEEQYTEMQNVMYNAPSPAQEEIDSWYSSITLGIAALERGNVAEQEAIQNALGEEYLQIYQAAMATKLGLMGSQEDLKAAVQENFCKAQ
jgi:hypothetical protein